ncbi:hypothetical protein V8C86DRAFT_2780308 [Haematococcus lacustris]
MLISINAPTAFGPMACAAIVPSFMTVISFFQRPVSGPVCQVTASLMTLTLGFTNNADNLAFRTLLLGNMGTYVSLFGFPCNSLVSMIASADVQLMNSNCANVRRTCLGP